MTTATPLSKAEVLISYNELAARPSFFAELTKHQYQKECVLSLARQIEEEITLEVYYLVETKPSEAYPTLCEEEEDKWQHWLKQMPEYAANQRVLALFEAPAIDKPALSKELFLKGFDFEQLDRLLADLQLMDPKTQTLMPEAKGAVWVGIAEGLRERKRLNRNKSGFGKALHAYYGEVVGSQSTLAQNNLTDITDYWRGRVMALVPELKH